eukprot:scaffold25933_cov64-Phaeocystis_antarctica.AAC.2
MQPAALPPVCLCSLPIATAGLSATPRSRATARSPAIATPAPPTTPSEATLVSVLSGLSPRVLRRRRARKSF